jgi:integrase
MSAQLIHIRKRYWLIRIEIAMDPNNKSIFKEIRFQGNKKEARAELNRLRDELSVAIDWRPADMTVNEYLDLWFDVVAENHYRLNTLANYKVILSVDIRSRVGHLKLAEVQPKHIREILQAMAARGVCSNAQRRLYYVTSQVFEYAVRTNRLLLNPVRGVKPPSVCKKEMRALTEDEVQRLLAVTDTGEYGAYFRTSISTGMRPGELAALRWHDIDFNERRIFIQRSLVWKEPRSEGWVLAPPKTKNGIRQVAISESLVNLLVEHKSRQRRIIERSHPSYEDRGFVFCNRTGRPLSRCQIVDAFKDALSRAGLPRTIRLYDLRHTCATLLLNAGEDIRVVSERLGHAGISITLETYVHVFPKTDRKTADRIETILGCETPMDEEGEPPAE